MTLDHEASEQLRRIRGVSWQWRDDVPHEEMGITPGALEAGVIAQEVRTVFPDLVAEHPNGYLMVDYPGLAMMIAPAIEELRQRLQQLEPSDALFKSGVEPVSEALERLESGSGQMSRQDYQALVGALVEAVKELDSRLSALEGEGRLPPPTPSGAKDT